MLPAIAGGCRANLTWLIPRTRLVNDTSVVAREEPLRGRLDFGLDSLLQLTLRPADPAPGLRSQARGFDSHTELCVPLPADPALWLRTRVAKVQLLPGA